MAGAGKKTFTAGEVLTASDVNTYLMEQSVMVFGGTAARSSAIPTPSTGMTTYIGTTGTATIPQIETYTGSAWQTPYGLTLLSTANLTAAASVSFTNVFSSAYTNYRVVAMLRGSASVSLFARFRENVTDVTTGYYGSGWQLGFAGGSGVSGSRNNGGDMFLQGIDSRSNGITSLGFDVTRNTATTGALHGFVVDSNQGNVSMQGYSNIGMSNFTGITIYPNSGTLTGSVRVFGYRES